MREKSMDYQVKIFRGTCATVELEVNAWLAKNNIVIRWLTQTEASMNILTMTVCFTPLTA